MEVNMKKGKSRNKRKKTRGRLLWIAIAVIGIAAVISAVCVAAISFVLILSISGCSDAPPEENTVLETVIDVQDIQEESEEDADEIISVCIDLYEKAEEENKLADLETIRSIVNRLGENGYSAVDSKNQIDMTEPEQVTNFCEMVDEKEEAEISIIHDDGAIGRMKFIYDGTDMYVVSTGSVWNENGKSRMSYISHTRIKEWEYTEKGWFCYELCVPEPPKVTEIVDGSCLIRVKPMTEEQREMSERCVRGLGYQGNNILCSNWDADHMEELDFNGMYEYLYAMKYGDKFNSEDYPDGIPKEEFESLIMEYLPITAEQIREYAVFDEENQIYYWARLGCFNYAPTFFGTSLPEVVNINENEDGTITLTVVM